MGDSGGGESTTTATIPPELSPLMLATGKKVKGLQEAMYKPGLIQPRAIPVAGPNILEKRAVAALPGLAKAPKAEKMAQKGTVALTKSAGRTPELTSEQILNDPNYVAAMDAYEQEVLPGVQNDLTRMGLGRSTYAADSVARGKADVAAPVISDIMASEQAAIDRQTTTGAQMIGELRGIGGAETARRGAAIEGLSEAGGTFREQVANARNKSFGDERSRLENIAMTSLFQPLGGFIPSTIGQSTVSNTDK